MNKPEGLDGDPGRRTARIGRIGGLPAPRMPEVSPLGWVSEPAPEAGATLVDIAAALRALAKHAGVIAFGVAVALAVGAAVTLLTRPSYTARAILQIDREAEKVVSAEDQTPVDNLGEEFFQTQYGLLKSRALAARVAESLNLTRDDAFVTAMSDKRQGGSEKPLTPELRRNAVIEILQANEGVTPERGSRLVAVTFSSPDPVLSARVANAFAENFITSALDRRFESSSYARDFLEKRLAQVKAKLEESERDLVAYAASQQIIHRYAS